MTEPDYAKLAEIQHNTCFFCKEKFKDGELSEIIILKQSRLRGCKARTQNVDVCQIDFETKNPGSPWQVCRTIHKSCWLAEAGPEFDF